MVIPGGKQEFAMKGLNNSMTLLSGIIVVATSTWQISAAATNRKVKTSRHHLTHAGSCKPGSIKHRAISQRNSYSNSKKPLSYSPSYKRLAAPAREQPQAKIPTE
jgi:hypothetical protein